MTQIRIRQAADLIGVSDDTVRRWIDKGELRSAKDSSGSTVIDGEELASFWQTLSTPPKDPTGALRSARNRFVGLVTKVTSDPVMSQVEMQCGRFRVVSLMSTEAVNDLDLKPGAVAVAVVKATMVVIEKEK